MDLNITYDQKRFFKKAFYSYYDVASELLQSEHAVIIFFTNPNTIVEPYCIF
jgi:hypothetical protein